MNRTQIQQYSRRYYFRYYRLVVVAVVVMMAVLAGSLVLGDSVRGTLRDRVAERLGNTETIITSGTGFLEDRIMQASLLSDAQGVLLVEGFVSVQDKLLPVYIWGTDNDSIMRGDALVNSPLQQKMEGAEDLVLHLPSHSLVPSGSLFVTQSYATQMRMQITGVKTVEEGGNLLLKNEQTLPLNVFVNRQELAEVMELENKINLILSPQFIQEEQFASIWEPSLSGIEITDSTLTSERIFIQPSIIDKVNAQERYFAYLVNDLIAGTDTVPYSFVSAASHWNGELLSGPELILSDYAATRLHVQRGDSVDMSYFVSRDLKNLETNVQKLLVKQVVPLQELQENPLLKADFPGLSNVEKCTDWDSDLPIHMDRIHQVDEDFWYAYKNTPKAIVAYDAVADQWSNSFGTATGLRFSGPLQKDALTLSDAEIMLLQPRADGLYAAGHGTDFSSLFMALGFFIIVSGILLMQNPLLEMFTQRKNEIQLYNQLGYSQGTVQKMLMKEAGGVILVASPFGILAGILYSGITLWLLGNVWSGATHTEGFGLHIQWLTLVFGWLAGVFICWLTLWTVIRSLQRPARALQLPTAVQIQKKYGIAIGCGAVTLLLVVLNFITMHSMALFIIAGFLWIVTTGLGLDVWICRRVSQSQRLNRVELLWKGWYATRRQQLWAFWSLAIGVFTVFAVGLNRPDFSDNQEAMGGYQLYVDSRVPMQYDLNEPAVRSKLNLQDLPENTRFLSFLRHDVDEASCLNLNKVSTPTVVGVDLENMHRFGLEPKHDATMPSVYVDQEALIWSMMKMVGDTLIYKNGKGQDVPVLIAGSYPTGIFHGNAIMAQDTFRELWPQETGVKVFLVETPAPEQAADLLGTALNEYGLRIQTTQERIAMFFEVTDTYLIIFLTLGGLGLLLGIFSLMILVRKNLTAQENDIRQYRALGFSETAIREHLFQSNVRIPQCALVMGSLGSIISISANVSGAGWGTWCMAAVCLCIIWIALYIGIKQIINTIRF